jgi:hypothetical protein
VVLPSYSGQDVQTRKPRPTVLTKAGVAGRGWEVRVDGEHKVDVGWLRVLQAKRECPLLRVVVQWMERTRGRGGRVKEVVEQFPNSVQKVFEGDRYSSSI